MKKALSLLAPLAVLSLTFTSCNNGGRIKPIRRDVELDRTIYTNKSDYSGERNILEYESPRKFAKAVHDAKKEQYKSEPKNPKMAYYNLKKNGLTKAMVTTNAEIDIDGEGVIIVKGEEPIDINSFAGGISDTITTSWSIDDNYLKVIDSHNSASYIKGEIDPTNGETKYWKCYTTEIQGKKYRVDITDYIKSVGGFENAVVIQAASNSSIKQHSASSRYIGLDISGFGGTRIDEESTNSFNEDDYYVNSFPIGSMLINNFDEEAMPLNLLNVLDLVTDAVIDLGLDIDFIDYSYNGKKDGKDSTAGTVDLGVKKGDLGVIKTIYDEVEKFVEQHFEIELPFALPKCSGEGTANYFLNYSNNFIHQQEILVDVAKLNLTFYPKDASFVDLLMFDIKNANVRAVINEDVKTTDVKIDDVKLSDYVILGQ